MCLSEQRESEAMPRRTASKRTLECRHALRVEPLEDRILLAAPMTVLYPAPLSPAMSSPSPASQPAAGQSQQTPPSAPADSSTSDPTPDMPGASSDNAVRYSVPAAQAGTTSGSAPQTVAASSAAADHTPTSAAAYANAYAPQPQAAALPQAQGQLAVAAQGQEKPPAESRPALVPAPPVPLPTPSGEALAVSLASAARPTPTTPSMTGGALRTPAVPAEQESPPEPVAGQQEPLAQTVLSMQTQPSEAPALERSAGLLALDLPALARGDWANAARRFLAVLDALDTEVGDRESLWVRLGVIGLTATTAIVLFELGRQHLRKQQTDDLDLAFAGWPARAPAPH
jgi:hypothetical protein